MPARVGRDDASTLLPAQPNQLRQEYFVDDVLRMATVPADVILSQRPIPQPPLAPPRYGYRRDPLTVYDVLATDRWAPQQRSWLSGAAAQGPMLAAPNIEEGQASGGTRNALNLGQAT